jgi:ATP-dependent RNA helicase RhlE
VDAKAFADLGLLPELVQALGAEGYANPTPIQTQAIPPVLAGSDLVGCAQTGTGKTAAFVLPLLQRLGARVGKPRALVLTPTRELALQIGERARAYGRHVSLRHAVIYGGVSQRRQERDLAQRPDLLVATPGRLLDLMRQGLVSLGSIEILVLDEADTMLDMGFIHDIKRLVAEVPKQRQTLLFSATMPTAIEALVRSMTRTPVRVSVSPESTPAERVTQSVFFVARGQKKQLLNQLLDRDALGRVLVFTRTKHGANRLAEQLSRTGIGAAAIHGNKSQSAREAALGNFREGKTPVLVATDVAARGIDVQGVSLVVNFDLPNVPESYVHRIGRTGRAGAEGRAISFCDRDERVLLRDIERLIKRRIEIQQHDLAEEVAEVAATGRGSEPARGGWAGRDGLPARPAADSRNAGPPRNNGGGGFDRGRPAQGQSDEQRSSRRPFRGRRPGSAQARG